MTFNRKIMNKLLIFSAMAAVLTTFTACTGEKEEVLSGENLSQATVIQYTTNDGNIIEIQNTGAFGKKIKKNSYSENKGTIEFEGVIDCIGNFAFTGITNLESIIIPDEVKTIGESAFAGCSGLISVTASDSLEGIGYAAFEGCSSLLSAPIGNKMTAIATSAFADCTSLTTLTIPDAVQSIGNAAFGGCTSLVLVTMGKGLKSVGASAFMGCSNPSLHFIFTAPEAPEIGDCAFELYYFSDDLTDEEFDLLLSIPRIFVPTDEYYIDVPSDIDDPWLRERWLDAHYSYFQLLLVNQLAEGLDDIKEIVKKDIENLGLSDLAIDIEDYSARIESAETAFEVFSLEGDLLDRILQQL